MKHHHLRELGQKHLGVASLSFALLARPIRNRMEFDGFPNGFGDCLLLLGRSKGELIDGIGAQIFVLAVVALDGRCDTEPSEFIQEGNLVAEELNQLVRISDTFPGGHMGGHFHTFIQWLETFVASTSPNLRETHFNRILAIFFIIHESLLQIRNAEDCLKSCVDPTGSVLVAKSEGCHLTLGMLRNQPGTERGPF